MTSPEISEKSILINALERHHFIWEATGEGIDLGDTLTCNELDAIADFILADRARIVEPLVKYVNSPDRWTGWNVNNVIDESLRRAGRKE
jgi:hypothetical protein